MSLQNNYDALIIGGGFYGCAIALHLKSKGLQNIAVIERENQIVKRASYQNQARIHNGYHYPRSFVTGLRSRVNFPLFVKDYQFAVKEDFISLYAIAKKNSKVTSKQFERFMSDIGAVFAADVKFRKYFDPRLVAEVYQVREFCFDASKLRDHFLQRFSEEKIALCLNSKVTEVKAQDDKIAVSFNDQKFYAKSVFNCTYAGLNNVSAHTKKLTSLKYELAEICLFTPPSEFKNIGITLMDGPFFSLLPFPAEGCHSLSHVSYTPHSYIINDGSQKLENKIDNLRCNSRFNYMLADACRYVPLLQNSQYLRSMFEIKTVLSANEINDGRPILFRKENDIDPKFFSILGGKIDNIYDVYQEIDQLNL